MKTRDAVTAAAGRPTTGRVPTVDLVVKLGGSLLAHPEYFGAALTSIRAAATGRRLVVVPGGGPFADVVRKLYDEGRLSDDEAHWMAILAMDQYAHLVSGRLADGGVVANPDEISAALDAGQVPVLAPSAWLRHVDPLPHTWSVTSDSIAAWVAGVIGARHLVLIKAPRATGNELVDAYFPHALPARVTHLIVPADRAEALHAALRGERSQSSSAGGGAAL